MLRKPFFAVIVSTLYLLVYIIFVNAGNFDVVIKMFLGSPLVLGWLAYTIVRHGKFTGRELGDNEEWDMKTSPVQNLELSGN